MMPPGRKIVFVTSAADAVWGVNWQYAHLVKHSWPGAMVNTIFRNESEYLSSDLIQEAVRATVFCLGSIPDQGLITFVDVSKVRSRNPGYCYLMSGWEKIGKTKRGHIVLAVFEGKAEAPLGMQYCFPKID